MDKFKNLTKFILSNFGPILVFYVANHFYGPKTAVFAAITRTIGEIIFHRLKGIPSSTFFKFSTSIVVVFGLLDLYFQSSVFFKYEGCFTSILVGLYFGSSLFSEKPLIQEFAEAQGRIKGDENADRTYFFRFLTAIWTVYFFVKAGFYCWVASHYSLEEGLAIRGVVGTASFYALLFISIFGATLIKRLLAISELLPSSRKVESKC